MCLTCLSTPIVPSLCITRTHAHTHTHSPIPQAKGQPTQRVNALVNAVSQHNTQDRKAGLCMHASSTARCTVCQSSLYCHVPAATTAPHTRDRHAQLNARCTQLNIRSTAQHTACPRLVRYRCDCHGGDRCESSTNERCAYSLTCTQTSLLSIDGAVKMPHVCSSVCFTPQSTTAHDTRALAAVHAGRTPCLSATTQLNKHPFVNSILLLHICSKAPHTS
jgi:hypothetical protein